jgi:hypothetical protein
MNLGGGINYASLKGQADAAAAATHLHANAVAQNPTPVVPEIAAPFGSRHAAHFISGQYLDSCEF